MRAKLRKNGCWSSNRVFSVLDAPSPSTLPHARLWGGIDFCSTRRKNQARWVFCYAQVRMHTCNFRQRTKISLPVIFSARMVRTTVPTPLTSFTQFTPHTPHTPHIFWLSLWVDFLDNGHICSSACREPPDSGSGSGSHFGSCSGTGAGTGCPNSGYHLHLQRLQVWACGNVTENTHQLRVLQ